MGQLMTREERELLSAKRREMQIERWQAHHLTHVADRIRMHVSPWFRDELGNPSRVVRCAE